MLEPLEGFPRPWFVCGGWAIDLFLGEVTRPHEDLEIGVFRSDQPVLRSQLAGWEFFKCARPGSWDPWSGGEWLEPPVHQVLACPPGSGPPPEPWEPGPGQLQFFLHEVEDSVWRSRRDPQLALPVEELFFSSGAVVLIVAPQIQLLYKAKHHLEKDELDFRAAVGRLSREQRSWLRQALEIVHPDDPWLRQLG